MSWKAFGLTVVTILLSVSAVMLYVSAGRAPMRKFIIYDGREPTYLMADEARIEGFCTVFFVRGERIAALCGQHQWIEESE